jgi:hypothetical protein
LALCFSTKFEKVNDLQQAKSFEDRGGIPQLQVKNITDFRGTFAELQYSWDDGVALY